MIGDGPDESVEHNIIGVLVNPNDLVETARAIIDISQNKRKRIEYGENGRNRVLNSFTWEKGTKIYANLFKKILLG